MPHYFKISNLKLNQFIQHHTEDVSTYPFRVLQESLVGLLPAKRLQELPPIGQHSVHMGFVFDRQL